MSATGIVATSEEEAAPAPRKRFGADKESRIELVVLPVFVVVAFLGYVWWRQTAHLDGIEQSALGWAAIRTELWAHVRLTVTSAAFVVLIAVPLGVALTRPGLRRAAPLVVGFANAGQAAPSIGLLVLLALWTKTFNFWIAILALTIYGILPVLRNTITGLQGVDPTLVEAGRGLGMSGPAVLARVELPLALPVIMTGVRTALVLIVGTAALATFVSAGGLGDALTAGITLFRYKVMISAALLIALLALLVEWVGRVLEAVLRPKGI